MFNLARIKAHFKAEIRAAKQFFKRQNEHEKTLKAISALNAPKPKVRLSKRAIARMKSAKIADDYAKLFRKHYYGGQFTPLKKFPGQTDFSVSALAHCRRVKGTMLTRKEGRITRRTLEDSPGAMKQLLKTGMVAGV